MKHVVQCSVIQQLTWNRACWTKRVRSHVNWDFCFFFLMEVSEARKYWHVCHFHFIASVHCLYHDAGTSSGEHVVFIGSVFTQGISFSFSTGRGEWRYLNLLSVSFWPTWNDSQSVVSFPVFLFFFFCFVCFLLFIKLKEYMLHFIAALLTKCCHSSQ